MYEKEKAEENEHKETFLQELSEINVESLKLTCQTASAYKPPNDLMHTAPSPWTARNCASVFSFRLSAKRFADFCFFSVYYLVTALFALKPKDLLKNSVRWLVAAFPLKKR